MSIAPRLSIAELSAKLRVVPAALCRAVILAGAMLLAPAYGTDAQQGTQPGRIVPKGGKVDTVRADTLRRPRQLPRDSMAKVDTGATRLVRPGAAARDTAQRELVKWAEPDSIMLELLKRPGYVGTKYQGDTVHFDAGTRTLALTGEPAAVERDRTLLVGDTVLYNDSTQIVRALGDSVYLRDPERNDSDIVASGSIKYDIVGQRGVITNLSTTVENGGQRWIVFGEHAAVVTGRDSVPPRAVVVGDSTASDRHSAFYARDGSITSCDETQPHYHFQSREIKVVNNRVLVARPAVLYIADVPVMWLPFIFQDLRKGRRSGILTPRFGMSELLRNSPSYRRQVENLGYYFAVSDYIDASVSLDWRSGAAGNADPGWGRMNAMLQYKWLDRFLDGRAGFSSQRQSDGSSMQQYSLSHRQDFSQRSHLTASLNYSTNTSIQRRSTIDPRAVVATIRSSANYQQVMGPFNMSLGGSQSQYPGRTELHRDFPTLSISTQSIDVTPWLTWTPTLNLRATQRLKIDQPGEFARIFQLVQLPDGTARVDSSAFRRRDEHDSAIGFQTPIKIFGVNISAGMTFSEAAREYPGTFLLPDTTATGSADTVRALFSRNFIGRTDWEVGFSLPPFLQGSWNVVPSIGLVNTDGGNPFFVRSHFSNGDWVSQSKRFVYGLSASPTFFALFNGFGPVKRFRHSIAPSVSYSYAPTKEVTNEFLYATGQRRSSYLGSLSQNRFSLGMATNLEAKVSSSDADTMPESGRKVRILSLTFSSLTYDLDRLKEIRRRRGAAEWSQGLTTDRVSTTVKSDLLPGIDIGIAHSLFLGNVLSDTAEFSPVLEEVRASFSLNRNSAIFTPLYRLLGGHDRGQTEAGATSTPNAPQPTQATQVGGPNTTQTDYRGLGGVSSGAGVDRIRNQQLPSGQGWTATFSLSSSRPRPQRGGTQVSGANTAACEIYKLIPPPAYTNCLSNPSITGGVTTPVVTTPGGAVYIPPPVTNLSTQLGFNLTPKWAAQWQTSYDFERKEFASHIVSLQRELHDWRATFAFTQAPNGAFSFSFFIALKAEPDIKFDYHKNTYSGS